MIPHCSDSLRRKFLRAAEATRRYSSVFSEIVVKGDRWDTFLQQLTVFNKKLNYPSLHFMCLSRSCPIEVTRAYIRSQLTLSEHWSAEWPSISTALTEKWGAFSTDSNPVTLPTFSTGVITRVSAFDALLLGGSVEQLRMVLQEFASLVWPYVRDALEFTGRHPLVCICCGMVSPAEALVKASALWNFAVQMGVKDTARERYFDPTWSVWKRNPTARLFASGEEDDVSVLERDIMTRDLDYILDERQLDVEVIDESQLDVESEDL